MTMPGLPRLIQPMLVSLRHELPADEESYGWELKWDGLRAIAYVSGSTIRLVSRNDKDMAASYPELGVLAERVSAPGSWTGRSWRCAAKAAVRTRSAPCWSASTTATSCDTRDTSAPALPRTCSPT